MFRGIYREWFTVRQSVPLVDSIRTTAPQMTTRSKESDLDWSDLPTDADGVPVLTIDGREFRLPYLDVLPQNVSLGSLEESIREEGIEYPIIVDDDDKVIDGMTRLYVARKLDLSLDEIPVERAEVSDEEAGWEKAIELNAVRRQMSTSMRRETIERIVDRKDWADPREHVSDLARLLGVHKSTISRDLDELFADSEVRQMKKRKQMLNISLTGMRNLDRLLEGREVLNEVGSVKRDEYRQTLEELISAVEDERTELSEKLSERADD